MEHQRVHTVELGKWHAGRCVSGGSNFSDEAHRLQNLYMADNEPAISFVAK